jgi:hypothetical protein
MEDFIDKFEEWTDEELTQRWNYLETKPLSHYVSQTMDDIEASLSYRRVVAWDADGKITHRD